MKEFWERRGTAIYTEADKPGEAELIAELHGKLSADEVEAIVNRHNEAMEKTK